MTTKTAKRMLAAIDIIIVAWVVVGLFTTISMDIWAIVSAVLIGIGYWASAKALFDDAERSRYE